MKILIVYSSRTGNTKKVAEAIMKVMPEGTLCCPVEQAPAPEAYDFIAVGFWADRENADAKAKAYMERIKGKRTALFATMGADPNSPHARMTMQNAQALLEQENTVTATFICQGRIDPAVTERLRKLPAGHPHAMTPDRLARHEEAASHPDETDLMNARAAFEFQQY